MLDRLYQCRRQFYLRTAMYSLIIIAACATLAFSHPSKWQDSDYQGSESNNQHDNSNGGGHHGIKAGYSAGSGLRNIAQGSAEQAHNAVQNQLVAAHQAAFMAKNTLAQAAAGAAATAQAALAGKQVLLQGLEQQYRDAKVALQGEQQQLQQAQRAASAAEQTAVLARQHVNILTSALNSAQATSDHANQAQSEAAGELASQVAMVGTAKQRLDALLEQLHGARIDFDATQAAAQKAQAAAQVAQSNAAEVASTAAALGYAQGHQGGGGDNGGKHNGSDGDDYSY